MIRLIKIRDPENRHDTLDITIELKKEDVTLPELLEALETFIAACGYTPCILEATYRERETRES